MKNRRNQKTVLYVEKVSEPKQTYSNIKIQFMMGKNLSTVISVDLVLDKDKV